MNKFMALYMAPAAAVKKFMSMPPEEMKAATAEWDAWDDEHAASIIDSGAPLNKTKRVDAGGVSDTKNEITGYMIVQAESHDDAAKLFIDHPGMKFEGGRIEVIEFTPMPGK
ncbi:hypothetical protein HY413_03190 [Candidatus Kaiserbacteria bacterium]|nr:hypothetical protein [Candidatus Kaiserbacteria bacterium]